MRLQAVTGAFLLFAAAGCGGGTDPATVTTMPSAGASASVVDDPPGSVACSELAVAIGAGSLMDSGVVDGVVNASRTADAPLADAADRLGAAYRAAVAASGKSDEPDKIAAVSAAASDMYGVCADSGLQTAG